MREVALSLRDVVRFIVAENRRLLWSLAGATALLQLVALALPLATRVLLDRLDRVPGAGHIALFGAGLAAVAIFRGVLAVVRGQLVLALESRADVELGRTFFERLLALPFERLARKTIGELLQGFSALALVRDLATSRLLGVLLDASMTLLLPIVMVLLFPPATFVVLAASVIAAVLTIAIGRRQAREQRAEIVAQNDQRSVVVEAVHGIATIKAGAAEVHVLRRWSERFARELAHALRRQQISTIGELVSELLVSGLAAGVLCWGAAVVLRGELSVGSLVAFSQLVLAFLGAVASLTSAALAVAVMRPQLDPVREVLSAGPAAPRPSLRAGALPGAVVLDDLSFRYAADCPWVLRGFSLRLEPAAKRAIIAPSGFGKTTILRLVAGLFAPQWGTIRIDGSEAPPVAFARYVPQTIQLYSGSILHNLRLLSGDAPVERILSVAEETGLAELVGSLPMRYDTVILPGGGSFSGGQRQLIAITAAAASESPLLLLDEPASNLDATTRERLARCPSLNAKTILYAAHEVTIWQS